MINLQRTKLTGGNFKNIIRLEYPCQNIEDVRVVGGDPPTLEDLANALGRHRSECSYCASDDPNAELGDCYP